VVEVLLERGADPSIRDPRDDATPLGWAEHAGGWADPAGRSEMAGLLRARG
jgi:hypothetical protein